MWQSRGAINRNFKWTVRRDNCQLGQNCRGIHQLLTCFFYFPAHFRNFGSLSSSRQVQRLAVFMYPRNYRSIPRHILYSKLCTRAPKSTSTSLRVLFSYLCNHGGVVLLLYALFVTSLYANEAKTSVFGLFFFNTDWSKETTWGRENPVSGFKKLFFFILWNERE